MGLLSWPASVIPPRGTFPQQGGERHFPHSHGCIPMMMRMCHSSPSSLASVGGTPQACSCHLMLATMLYSASKQVGRWVMEIAIRRERWRQKRTNGQRRLIVCQDLSHCSLYLSYTGHANIPMIVKLVCTFERHYDTFQELSAIIEMIVIRLQKYYKAKKKQRQKSFFFIER